MSTWRHEPLMAESASESVCSLSSSKTKGTTMKEATVSDFSTLITKNTETNQLWRTGRKIAIVSLSFIFSIGINIYNTVIFSKKRYNLGLPFFSASLYEVTQLILAVSILALWESGNVSRIVKTIKAVPIDHFKRFILPCGFAAAINIGLSNASLQYISLSFYTMVKSSAPIFVVIFAFLFGLEQPSTILFMIIATIGVGIVLTVWGAFSFNFMGFVFVFGAAIVSGLRWTLTQLIIEKKGSGEDGIDEDMPDTSGPLNTILILAPVIGMFLLMISLLIEGPLAIVRSPFFSSFDSAIRSFGVCALGGLQAFLLILTEYKVVEETSVLTFSVTGVIKELLLIALSVWIFKDEIHFINLLGAMVTIMGLCFYNIYKVHSNKRLSRTGRRFAEKTIQNMFIAVPTSDPPGWMFDEIVGSSPHLYPWEHDLSCMVPHPSPTGDIAKSFPYLDDALSEMASPKKVANYSHAFSSASLPDTRPQSPSLYRNPKTNY